MRWAGVLALGLAVALPSHAEPKKVACIGDSITFGIGVRNPERQSYPAKLAAKLGRDYRVKNFGFSGATLLRSTNAPYEKTPAFSEATAFRPKIVVILLGTNDSKPRNWDGRQEKFLRDYAALVTHFKKLPSKPRIFLCLPPPSFQPRGDDIREVILERQRRLLREFATQKKLPLIDLQAPFKSHREWLPDGVHPNEAGADAIARAVAAAIQS